MTEKLKRLDGRVDKRSNKSNCISPKKATAVRKKLDYLIDEKGVRNSFIAEKTGIWPGTILRFRKGLQRTFLNDEKFKKLDKLLNSYDYKDMK